MSSNGRGGSTSELQPEQKVRFPDDTAPTMALPEQVDAIATNFAYAHSIRQKDPKPDPDDFGTTRPYFTMTDRAATLTNGTYNVTGTVNAEVTFQVDGGTRTDIESDSDPAITQTNYPTVASDLTPSPAAVPARRLYKNQPPRTHFWAEDLTITHERFHADEDVKFGREATTQAQNWMNTQTARSYDDLEPLFASAIRMVAHQVDTAMALPGRENRAYANGASDYQARAQAIKAKGDAKGYVPAPPAPKTPATPPASTPTTATPTPTERSPK